MGTNPILPLQLNQIKLSILPAVCQSFQDLEVHLHPLVAGYLEGRFEGWVGRGVGFGVGAEARGAGGDGGLFGLGLMFLFGDVEGLADGEAGEGAGDQRGFGHER